MRNLHFILSCCVLASLLTLQSCRNGSTSRGQGGDTLRLKYATGLTIVDHGGYTQVSVADPWHKGQTLHTYILVDKADSLPHPMPKGTLVRTPLDNAMVSTTVHSQLFIGLHAMKAIGGVCDINYINIPQIQQGLRSGTVKDCGSSMQPNVERIVDLHPDAMLLSPYENSGGYGKVEKLGVPIIECADYMEPSPLARAEWMKFYALLLGKEKVADSLFNVVERRYLHTKRMATRLKKQPKVLIDKPMSGVWYVPCGQSTIGQMVADAGGNYAFATVEGTGSKALPLERIVDEAEDADLWLVRYDGAPLCYDVLARESEAYRRFKAYKNRRVWACNVQTSGFFELTPFRPDLLIEDFFAIFHPTVAHGHKTRFYHVIDK